MSASVFVSYSRVDAGWVFELVRLLEGRGFRVWVDQRDIPVSSSWLDEVRDAIAGQELFLLCDSPASRASEACQLEAEVAFDLERRTVEVEVGRSPQNVVFEVVRRADELDRTYRSRTLLSASALHWDRVGRPRRALASRVVWRRLRGARRHTIPPAPVERAFLTASRRRLRRQRLLVVGAIVTVASLWSASQVFDAADERLVSRVREQAATYESSQQTLEYGRNNPYLALSVARDAGQTESVQDARIVEQAHERAVPDRRQTVRSDAAWRKLATRRSEGGELSLDRAAWQAGRLRVRRRGTLYRVVQASGPITAGAISPDGRWVAAASGGRIQFVDLETGRIRRELAGAPGVLTAVGWDTAGRVWGRSGDTAVSWAPRAAILLDDRRQRWVAVWRGTSSNIGWALSESGWLVRFSTTSGNVSARSKVVASARSGGGAPDGRTATISAGDGIYVVDLTDPSRRRKVAGLPGECAAGRPVYRTKDEVLLPCIEADQPVLSISVPAARVTDHVVAGRHGVFAVRPAAGSPAIYATDSWGVVWGGDDLRDLRQLFLGQSGAYGLRIAVDPRNRAVAIGSNAAGLITGMPRGFRTGDGMQWDHVMNVIPDSQMARAVAVSDEGDAMAYGFTNGDLLLMPAENILPQRHIKEIVGEIRDMATTDGGLLVVTMAGQIARVEFCGRCLSNAEMAKEATTLLKRSRTLGLANIE